MCEFYGPRGYVADLSFFIDGKWIPADLEKAEELAWLLYRTGTIGAEDILKHSEKRKIYNLQAPDIFQAHTAEIPPTLENTSPPSGC